MMYKKAMLFGDTEIADRIMRTSDPKIQKSLGRKVKTLMLVNGMLLHVRSCMTETWQNSLKTQNY